MQAGGWSCLGGVEGGGRCARWRCGMSAGVGELLAGSPEEH